MEPLVLITRPSEDASALTKLLQIRGYKIVYEPLLSVFFLRPSIDLSGIQAILITSANGIRALATIVTIRTVRIFVVGYASAQVCYKYGFNRVTIADGNASTLISLVRHSLLPEGGTLLYAAGSITTGNLPHQLKLAGFLVRKLVLYRADVTASLTQRVTNIFSSNEINAILFYSSRTAKIFTQLVLQTGVYKSLKNTCAYCLSDAVQNNLSSLPWKCVRVAVVPSQEALLSLLDHDWGLQIQSKI